MQGRIHDYSGSTVVRIRAMWPKPNMLSCECGRICGNCISREYASTVTTAQLTKYGVK